MKLYIHLCLSFLIVLVGCTPEAAQWTPAESPKKNKVERTVFVYSVNYPIHEDSLEEKEKNKFQRFLKDIIPNPSAVIVTLQEYGGNSEKRIWTLKREILKYGVPEDLIIIDGERLPECDVDFERKSISGVDIIVEKFLTIPPSCANFSQNIGNATQGVYSSNYGCAVEATLGMMVANPRDLVQGRARGLYDGVVLTAGVRRYREGAITPLIQSATTTQQQQQQSSQTPTTSSGSRI